MKSVMKHCKIVIYHFRASRGN